MCIGVCDRRQCSVLAWKVGLADAYLINGAAERNLWVSGGELSESSYFWIGATAELVGDHGF